MSNQTIESYLITEEGPTQLGVFMAANNMYNEVLSQLTLLDIDQAIMTTIQNAYNFKLNEMREKDASVSSLTELNPDIQILESEHAPQSVAFEL